MPSTLPSARPASNSRIPRPRGTSSLIIPAPLSSPSCGALATVPADEVHALVGQYQQLKRQLHVLRQHVVQGTRQAQEETEHWKARALALEEALLLQQHQQQHEQQEAPPHHPNHHQAHEDADEARIWVLQQEVEELGQVLDHREALHEAEKAEWQAQCERLEEELARDRRASRDEIARLQEQVEGLGNSGQAQQRLAVERSLQMADLQRRLAEAEAQAQAKEAQQQAENEALAQEVQRLQEALQQASEDLAATEERVSAMEREAARAQAETRQRLARDRRLIEQKLMEEIDLVEKELVVLPATR